MQMASAARLAATLPQVGEELRSRYRVVLLDEYQDTGHAQRIALSALFGGGVDDGLALTAVGDPIQSIYGWRGASATNLPRFTTDFPLSDGTPAPVLELRTSWRNPPRTLQVANAVSAEARRRSVAVHALRSRPDAPPGTVRCALLPTLSAEREWIADHLHARYRQAARRRRRSADGRGAGAPQRRCRARSPPRCAPAASPWRSSGWPGCWPFPRSPTWSRCCAWSPTPRPARRRCGCSPGHAGGSVPATSRRCGGVRVTLGGSRRRAPRVARAIAEAAGPDADTACLADAIADPGPAGAYSAAGYRRIAALADELSALRGHLGHPLPDLVAEVRRVLGVDCEVRAAARRGRLGRHRAPRRVRRRGRRLRRTDRAATDVGRRWPACWPIWTRPSRSRTAWRRRQSVVARDRVQVLTVHAAKGLEWQVVAVAHLSGGIVPVDRVRQHLAHRRRRAAAAAAR